MGWGRRLVERRLSDALAAMDGTLISGNADRSWSGALIDSRQASGGELFFALQGDRRDGHEFVPAALSAGCAAAVVGRPVAVTPESCLVQVQDPYEALHALTRSVRADVPRHLVAITGSTGKTTTKELLAAMLAKRYRVARNPGNLNNLLGFPLALLGIADDTEWMVAEMGMSKPGELGEISRLGKPQVALFTNVRPVHLESFGTLEAVAEAKSELLEGLTSGGLVVANADDAEVCGIARRWSGDVFWYGIEQSADVRAEGIEPLPGGIGSRFLLVADGVNEEVQLPLYGTYNVENCLAAAACALALGLSAEQIATAMKEVEAPDMRGVVYRLSRDILVIDDSYNSNPVALEKSLASARQVAAPRHVAVLGDMLELGDEAAQFHRRAGEMAVKMGYSLVVGVGAWARELVASAAASGSETQWYEDASVAGRELAQVLNPGDLVLVKGSRGIGLDRVVQALVSAEKGN